MGNVRFDNERQSPTIQHQLDTFNAVQAEDGELACSVAICSNEQTTPVANTAEELTLLRGPKWE